MVFPKSALLLVVFGFLALFSGDSLAADSNKEKLKQMLDNANKPQAVSNIPSNFLSGLWVGYYDYDSRTSSTPPANTFSIVFEQTPEQINAIIMEPAPGNPDVYAQFAEAVNASVQGTTLSFTKVYQSGSMLQYTLSVDVQNKVLTGKWKINDQVSGPVKMWRMNAGDLK
ncbi:MAG TPA: hypothetical protein VIM93_05865 [Kangiella sp.]